MYDPLIIVLRERIRIQLANSTMKYKIKNCLTIK